MPDAAPLKVENSMDQLVVLLFAPGRQGKEAEPIEGMTRLQKLIFLLQQGAGPKELVAQAKRYLYRPYKMGPYSQPLKNELEELISVGLVSTERLEYLIPDDMDEGTVSDDIENNVRGTKRVESYRFRLTCEGKKVGKELWENLPGEQQKGLSEFKGFFNSLSLRQLLIFVYEKYPDFATESTIKKSLGLR